MTNPITLRRNNDPYTSHESANKIEATQMEKIVWEVIDSFGETIWQILRSKERKSRDRSITPHICIDTKCTYLIRERTQHTIQRRHSSSVYNGYIRRWEPNV